jgi:predicted MFS family arabinose efflux permease
MAERQFPTVLLLGSTQTLAWASSYYLPAVLTDPIAKDLGISSTVIFGIFSAALLLSAFLGPRAGRQIDMFGGNGVLAVSNILLAGGLILLGLAQGIFGLCAAWLLLGLGIAFGLYDSAFAALGRIYGGSARKAITGITLLAGFASTIGWPLSSWGVAQFGWREVCFGWAAAHLLFALPLHLFVLQRPPPLASTSGSRARVHIPIDRTMVLLAFAFAAAWIVTAAMAAHFPRIMEAAGASPAQAIAAGALIGPAQVAARMLEAGLLTRYHAIVSARLATLTHPVGVAVLALAGGGVAASAFAVLHGAGNGVLTIARGTVPLAIFGPENYGYRLGLIGAPARLLQAGAPLAFSLLIDHLGAGVLAISAALSLSACVALLLVRPAVQHAHAD